MEGIYVSAFQIFNNIYDIKIDFSAIEPMINESGDAIKDDRIVKSRITMSPALAKELASVLTDVVKEYENRFGQIPDVK